MMKRRTYPTLSPEEAALLIQNGAIFAAGGFTDRSPERCRVHGQHTR
jgi:hypothetical protein